MKLPLAFTIWLALVTYGLSDIQVTPLSSPGIPLSQKSTICHITVFPIHSSAYRSDDLHNCGPRPTHSLWPNSGADFPVQTSRASPSQAAQSRATLSRISPSRVTPFRATPSRLHLSRSSLSVINPSRVTTSRLSALRATSSETSFVRPQTTTQRTSQDAPKTSITAIYLSPTSTQSSFGAPYKGSSSAQMSLGRHGVVFVMTIVVMTTLALVL